jgi:hypothetical protein
MQLGANLGANFLARGLEVCAHKRTGREIASLWLIQETLIASLAKCFTVDRLRRGGRGAYQQ